MLTREVERQRFLPFVTLTNMLVRYVPNIRSRQSRITTADIADRPLQQL